MSIASPVNQWQEAGHAKGYLARVDGFSQVTQGDGLLLELIPATVRSILDLGTGDGRALAAIKAARPAARGVGVDFSPTMLAAARKRFAGDATVTIVEHNFDEPLPDLGRFDAIISRLAIHHATDRRKRELYREVFDRLNPGGVFCNLEHVASVSRGRHAEFLSAFGQSPETEDPSNKLASAELQLNWLRQIGFVDVDCYWKWREMALLAGVRPAA